MAHIFSAKYGGELANGNSSTNASETNANRPNANTAGCDICCGRQ
jgi:hypothetical protein